MLATFRMIERFDASEERVFHHLADADGLSSWSGAPTRVVAGPRETSCGTVRRIELGALRIDEEILAHAPPRRLVYRIVRGLPLLQHHLAEVLVEREGEHTLLSWSARFGSPVPGVAAALCRSFEAGIRRALPRLRSVL